jgi:large subunit ribosomal protein L15
MARKEGRKKKYLGRRSFGGGNVKNRRGSGNRGGRGNAGLHKHRYSWTVKYAPDWFGKHGFVNYSKKKVETMHLYEINRRALMNKLEKKENRYYFEFDGKILGTGELTVPLMVKAMGWSKNAEEKIKKMGGEIAMLPEPKGKPKALVLPKN